MSSGCRILWPGCPFPDLFGEGGQAGFVHGGYGIGAETFEDGVCGLFPGDGPVGGGGGVDVAETDGFGGGFELGAAVGPLALDEEAGLVEDGEDAADHDGTGMQGFGDGGGGLHGVRGEREVGEDTDAEAESTVLGHVSESTIGGSLGI